MAQSLANILIHIVYSTRERIPYLQDAELRGELYAYMAGILKNQNCPALAIGGVADHIHILCQLARTMTVAQLLEISKSESSKWLKAHARGVPEFHWQNGYAAFSVSQSNAPRVRQYVSNQTEHHRTRSFQDELRLFLRRHHVEYDERYIWD